MGRRDADLNAVVPSPCRNICRIHEPSGHCVGCGRTLDEIALWSVLDDDDKRAVWALLAARLQQLPAPPSLPPVTPDQRP